MRAFLWTPVLVVAGAGLTPLLAQQGATRNVDDYVCAFTNECEADATPAASEGTGQRKGRSSSTRGFSLSRPPAALAGQAKATVAPAAPAGRRGRIVGQANVTPKTQAKRAPGRKPVATAERRVDLRLTFETGSAVLTEQAKEEARVFAEALRVPKLASRKFVIEGHTDSVGSRPYNLDLSRRRAQAVVDYLASLGVDPSRLRTVGYGFDRPLDGRSAKSEENRRVEAVLAS